MGLTQATAQFLRHLRATGVSFRETLTVGHQGIYMDASEYESHLRALDVVPKGNPSYSDEFFQGLGAEKLEFADYSPYEGATLLHDFNMPLPSGISRQFDCVFDGGALEHVFNFPQALSTCMKLTRPGGHLLLACPGNNYFGHGFYQLSPELFFRALSPSNGFEVIEMLTFAEGQWYSIADPAAVQGRVELITSKPLLFFVAARRQSEVEPFQSWPQQSDYVTSWSPPAESDAPAVVSLKERLASRSPMLRRWQSRWRTWQHRRSASLANASFFKPVALQG